MKLYLFLLALIVLLGIGAYYEYQLQQQDAAAFQQQRAGLDSKLEDLKKQNQALQAGNDSVSNAVDDLRKQTDGLTSQVHSLQAQVASEAEAMKAAAPAPETNAAPVAPTPVVPAPSTAAAPLNGPLPAAKPSDLDLADHSVQVDPLEPPGGIPRVYVGSAYQPAMTDMATKYDDWKIVRAYAGFHEHPVGWAPSFRNWGLSDQIIKAYAHHYFTAEEDIGGLVNRPGYGVHWARTFFEQAALANEKWTCTGLFVNFDTSKMVADPAKAASDLAAYTQGAKELNIPVFLLFSPVSPEAVRPESVEGMNRPYENLPVWVWIAQHAGAVGVGIDYPAGFYDHMSQDRRELGRRIATTTQRAGLKFAWMFNGGTSVDDTKECAESLHEDGVKPDFWIISHFHNKEYPGTPETGETVTGQARALIQGKY